MPGSFWSSRDTVVVFERNAAALSAGSHAGRTPQRNTAVSSGSSAAYAHDRARGKDGMTGYSACAVNGKEVKSGSFPTIVVR